MDIDNKMNDWFAKEQPCAEIIGEHTSIAMTSFDAYSVGDRNRTVYVVTIFYKEQ